MKRIIILLITIAQTAFAQFTKADLVYKCDFESNDPYWKPYNEKAFISSAAKGKFTLEHVGKDETWSQTNDMMFNPMFDYEVEVSMCQLSGADNKGYGIIYNYKGSDNSNAFYISANGYFTVNHYTKGVFTDDIAWKESDKIIKGLSKYNKLTISRRGDNLHFFINGVEVASLPHPKFQGIFTGFFIGGVMKAEVDYAYAYQKKRVIRLVDNPNSFGEKIHLGTTINSSAAEICPVISADEKSLFVTRTYCKENTGGYDDYDIWSSTLNKDSSWTPLKNIGSPLNNKGNNFVISVSHDNNSLVLGNVYHGEGKALSNGISYSHKTKTGWSYPKEMKIKNFYNNNEYNEACLAPDGKTILLCVERDDTHGDKDIYFSHLLSDSSWSEPENLGPIVNSYSNETGAFLASDGKTLYFSSSGHVGYGSNDIFITKRLDDTWKHWTEPKNLGPKINTKHWDAYYTMPASGDYAYVISTPKNTENADIYKIKQPESVKPEPVILIHGVVHNSDTKKPMQAVVSYYELGSKKTLGSATSNVETGAFTIALPKGRKYCFNAQHEGFISVNANTDATVLEIYKEENIDLYLSPVKTGQSVVLHNLFFVSDEHRILPESFPELDKLHDLLVAHPEMKIEVSGHTSINSSGEKYNHDLSTGRAEAVKKYLIAKGINEKRIAAKGYGFSKPIYTDKTEVHQALNRRIEFSIVSY
ncbi:MAG: OmpA family protein [Bacteroidetes bacterium]|nr:OmpA family protein [Bacteroidota bacterium]